MAVAKVDIAAELAKVDAALEHDISPCSICKGTLLPCHARTLLDYIKAEKRRVRAEERKARRIKRARRAGNLIAFPKLS